MLKLVVAVFFLVSISLGQPSDSRFSVRYAKHAHFVLSATQMADAEKLYQSACAVVERELRANKGLRPRFTVLVGAKRNELHSAAELWLTEWNPELFTQAVVVLSFDQMLSDGLRLQLTRRALQYNAAPMDVSQLKQDH